MAVLHDYECNVCERVVELTLAFEQRETPCLACEGGVLHRIVSPMRRGQLDIFSPYHEESLGEDMPLVTSKRHLARLCEERGLVSKELAEGYKNYGRRREL